MDKALRNSLRNTVTQCRRLLERAVGEVLEGTFGIDLNGRVQEASEMIYLPDEDRAFREQLLAHLRHIESHVSKPADAVAQLVRETAFTHLNRLCAYKMLERRKLIREAVSRGLKSNGFMRYLSYNPDDEKLWSSGKQDLAYRHYLEWLAARRSEEIGVLFSPHDPANRLFPPQRVLDEVLALINAPELDSVWGEDETIGWVYQYFTPKELRDQARKESAAPRNSYELAFRNQFFTPRYVVEFLVDNTLGRIWYEMRGGNTRLAEQCRYMVRRRDEVFLAAKTSTEGEFVSREIVDAVKLLQSGDETSFPPFGQDDRSVRRFIQIALTVNGYDRAAPESETEGPQHSLLMLKECIFSAADMESFSTQEILDAIFIMQRGDYWAGGGELEQTDEYIRIGNELRRRIIKAHREDLSQEEKLRQPVFIPYRPKKDPRELRILDPACGSGHFLLYCFDLLLTIYEEAYDDQDLGPALKEQYPTLDDLRRAVPGLILAHNLHGVDIDLRATQIAALALWLRAQRAFSDYGIDPDDRPKITRSNIVCAEPMPGEKEMLDEFTARLDPPLLGQLVRVVFDKMRLAGEAGSLLKIEEELSGAISAARKEWQREWQRATDRRGQPMLFTTGEMDRMLASEPRQMSLFDVSGITDEQFWDELETRVLESLRSYASEAANGAGYQRNLFAEDAVQGFAFVDLCRKRFDVVLMNPPFGEPSIQTVEIVERSYPESNSNLYCAFVIRGVRWLTRAGLLGCITDRTFIVKETFQAYREFLYSNQGPIALGDLGWEVLDTANVETAAYTTTLSEPRHISLEQGTHSSTPLAVFFDMRAFAAEEKPDKLLQSTTAFHAAIAQDSIITSRKVFLNLPRRVMSYWLPIPLQGLFAQGVFLDSEWGAARRGMSSGKTEFACRLLWEVDSRQLGTKRNWNPANVGGGQVPFHRTTFMAFYYRPDWGKLNEFPGFRPQNLDCFWQPAIGWGKRTEALTTQLIPDGQITAEDGQIFVPHDKNDIWFLLGVLNSVYAQAAVNAISGLHKEPGYFGSIPLPRRIERQGIPELTRSAYDILERQSTHDEVSPKFILPLLLEKGQYAWSELVSLSKRELARIDKAIDQLDELVLERLFTEPNERDAIKAIAPVRKSMVPSTLAVEGFVDDLLSWAVGCAFGRWDVRLATGERPIPELPDPFAPLPVCSPGMLTGEDGLPLRRPSEGYPLKVDWDGILTDDPDHPDDIVRGVRGVFDLLWGERAEAIEREACDILGVKELRDYFRDPRRFWDDHVRRYSKSRRKAPIYWLLQSPKRNYALWLYYHRLDSDLLFKALVNYVEPKIRLEEGKLDALTAQRQATGTAGKEARQVEKSIEKQEAVLADLREFRDRLERAAKLYITPDLNDGVVLNIAPLWELVPWKEAKTYWEEMLKGKYEWSSIGKQLKKKGLVPAEG